MVCKLSNSLLDNILKSTNNNHKNNSLQGLSDPRDVINQTDAMKTWWNLFLLLYSLLQVKVLATNILLSMGNFLSSDHRRQECFYFISVTGTNYYYVTDIGYMTERLLLFFLRC